MLLEKKLGLSKDIETKEFDLTKRFDFSSLEIRKAKKIDKFYYFFDVSDNKYCSVFILDDKIQVQRRCCVTLIESQDDKLVPRFEFFTWDKKAEKKQDLSLNKPFKARVQFDGIGSMNLWKLIGFLTTIKNVSLENFSSFKVIDSGAYISEFKNKEELEKFEELKKIFADPNLDEKVISKALFDKRKGVIDEFKGMLEDESSIGKYKEKYEGEIKKSGSEAIWHHFLKNNDWLLGLNIDIKFICDFIDETNVGIPNTEGATSPIADMLGVSDFTTLVEFKASDAKIFTEKKETTARANTWSFSDEFIDGISQCLGQKFDWDKTHETKDLVDEQGQVVNQDCFRTVDPKTIFIIGNKQKELSVTSTNKEVLKKRDTLQRFSRNSRNVEIVSYDELYERAYFIVYGEKAPELNFNSDEANPAVGS